MIWARERRRCSAWPRIHGQSAKYTITVFPGMPALLPSEVKGLDSAWSRRSCMVHNGNIWDENRDAGATTIRPSRRCSARSGRWKLGLHRQPRAAPEGVNSRVWHVPEELCEVRVTTLIGQWCGDYQDRIASEIWKHKNCFRTAVLKSAKRMAKNRDQNRTPHLFGQ